MVLKVLLAPALVALAAFVSWRWGQGAGGRLLGLPLLSGPVSLLLFVQYGAWFARSAARGTLLGVAALATFCLAYVLLARRRPWWQALLGAYAACLLAAGVLVELAPDLAWSLVLVLVVLVLAAWRAGEPASHAVRPAAAPVPRELAKRMALAGASVLVVTGVAGVAGPAVAGVLAPLPVASSIMAVSVHRRGDSAAAAEMLRGTLAGAWGAVAFFAIVAFTVSAGHPLGTYLLAAAAAVACSLAVPWVRKAERRVAHVRAG